MKKIIQLLFYKFYRFLQIASKADDDHCSFNAMAFTYVLLSMNLTVIFFTVTTILHSSIVIKSLKSVIIVSFAITFGFYYYFTIVGKGYVYALRKIWGSDLIGKKGNWIAGIYIGLSVTALLVLIGYFVLRKHF